jgi:hypothetical protein
LLASPIRVAKEEKRLSQLEIEELQRKQAEKERQD